MAKKAPLNPADYIEPLYMNGLHGRMLRLKPRGRKNKEILVIYGQHASLERMFSIAEDLNKYGGVTIPDLPGFGGMQSFYRLKEKPTVDNLADYLAAFIKLRYKNRRITVIGVSFGFAIVTRMLQKYPEIIKKVDVLISAVGFVHREDFLFKRHHYWALRYSSKIASYRTTSSIVKHLIMRPAVIRTIYLTLGSKNPKLLSTNQGQRDSRIAYEIHLWRVNDPRTYMYITNDMLKLDLSQHQIDLPVHHIAVATDRYFDNQIVEQHLKVIYSDAIVHGSKSKLHMPTLSEEADTSKLIPASVRKILKKN